MRTPISISWKLGRDPKPGASGKIHIVSRAKSLCIADQGPGPGEKIDSADFPARITYAASYDIYINNVRFVEDQPGVAVAVGVKQIPPIDVLVAFEKPHIGTVLGNHIEFKGGPVPGCTRYPKLSIDME